VVHAIFTPCQYNLSRLPQIHSVLHCTPGADFQDTKHGTQMATSGPGRVGSECKRDSSTVMVKELALLWIGVRVRQLYGSIVAARSQDSPVGTECHCEERIPFWAWWWEYSDGKTAPAVHRENLPRVPTPWS
jgi:hypothetical protein